MPRLFASIATALGLLAAAAAGAQTAAPLQVASLGPVNGKVMVNKGKGFVAARQGTALAPGDRLISLNGASTVIVYPDGCAAEMRENSLLAVDQRTNCSTKPVATGATEPVRLAQAIGGAPPVARRQADDEYCSNEARQRRAEQRRAAGQPAEQDDGCPPLAFWTTSKILGVAAWAGYSAYVVNRSNSSDDKPISAR
jgi:hypothetical protein